MSKQVNYNENLCSGAAIRDDKGRRISKLFEAPHPKMTVGYAKNLIMPNTPTEQEFNFRQAGGGVIEDGVAVIDKVKGNSVVWNQIIAKPYTFGETRDYTFSSWFEGGSRSINDKGQFIFITNGGTTGVGNSLCIAPRNTHKYLLSYKVKANIASLCTIYEKGDKGVIVNIAEADKWYYVSCIADNTDENMYSSFLNAIVAANSPETTVTIDEAKVTDLTQMFGAGNEPSTYEEFLQRKPKVADEYAYNEGTIINNKVEKVVTTGKNLWDEEWELGAITNAGVLQPSVNQIRTKHFIPVSPSTTYFFLTKNIDNFEHVVFFGEDKTYISYAYVLATQLITTPEGTKFIKFDMTPSYGATYNHDICINLSDPAINGQYFPYEKHELDLSWVKEIKDAEGVKLFEDGMRSAGTAYDEVGAKKAVKRFAEIDLGNLDWSKDWWEDSGRLFAKLPGKASGFTNIISTIGETIANDSILKNKKGICGNGSNNYIYVGDAKSHTSADDFIQSLNGVKAIYELATPIEVEYDEKNLSYPVVAGGTEEAIASEPSSAFRADIGYGIDAVKTILDLRARVKALEGK